MTGETEVTICATNTAEDTLTPTVTIWCTKLDHNILKLFSPLPIARQKDTSGDNNKHTGTPKTGTSDTRLVDIGMLNESINLQGFLIDETTLSAQGKKDFLRDLTNNYRKIKMYWGTGVRKQSYLGNISKIGVTETAGIIGVQAIGYESEENFSVQLSFTVGTDT